MLTGSATALTRDPAVVELQLLLATRGYIPGPIDGIRGPMTQAAFEKAQWDAMSVNKVEAWLRAQPSVHVQVPRVTTPLVSLQVKSALMTGHFATFDVYPSSNRLRMARAQMGVEHGLDGAHVHTFNLGNVMTGTGYAGAWFAMTADEEQLVATRRRALARQGVRVPRRSTWRAAATPEEGGMIYWGMMREHFAAALKVFDSGDPPAAAHALKLAGYMTARGHGFAADPAGARLARSATRSIRTRRWNAKKGVSVTGNVHARDISSSRAGRPRKRRLLEVRACSGGSRPRIPSGGSGWLDRG